MKIVFTKQLFVLVIVLFAGHGVGANPLPGKENVNHQEMTIKEFRYAHFQTMDTDKIDKALVPQHFFGDDVAVLYYVFKKTYITEQTDYSRATSTQKIQKLPIYNSVIRMNKLLKKTVKKGDYTKEEAAVIMKDCLHKSYAVFFVDTADLEVQIAELTGLEQYIALYQNISFE